MPDINDTPIAISISSNDVPASGTRAPRIPQAVEELGMSINEFESRLMNLFDKLAPILEPEMAEPGEDPGKTMPETSDIHAALIRQSAWLNRMTYQLNRIISRVDL